MKFSLIPVSFAALLLGFSTVQAFAGESQASTMGQFGGEGYNQSSNNSNATMENKNGNSGLDKNEWGNNPIPWGSNSGGSNGQYVNQSEYKIPTRYPGNAPRDRINAGTSAGTYIGGGGGGSSTGQVQSYQWQESKYKPYSYDPPAQYRASQARTTASASKKPTAGTKKTTKQHS